MMDVLYSDIMMIAPDRVVLDETYAIAPGMTRDALFASIRCHGVVHPVLLDGEHRVVAGRMRCEIAVQLGISEIPALIVDADPLSLFTSNIHETFSLPGAGDPARAVVVRTLQDRFSLSDSEIIKRFLPMMGLSPSGKIFADLMQMAAFSDAVLE